MRYRLSNIGSAPMNVILPPVSCDDKPIPFISSLNAAEMSSSSEAAFFESTAFLAITTPPTVAHAVYMRLTRHHHHPLLMGFIASLVSSWAFKASGLETRLTTPPPPPRSSMPKLGTKLRDLRGVNRKGESRSDRVVGFLLERIH